MVSITSDFTAVRWSPYAVGIGIGILSWLSFLISGKLIVTSTTRAGGMIEERMKGDKAKPRPYYQKIKLMMRKIP